MTQTNSNSPSFFIDTEDAADVTLVADGIILMDWNKNIPEIKLEHVRKALSQVKEISKGEKYPIFITISDFLHINHDALKYAVSNDAQQHTLANAVLIDNLAKTLVFNFFMKTMPPSTPTRAFKKMSDGMAWLRKMKQEHENKAVPDMINENG